LLLLLGDLLWRHRRLIDQRGGLSVLLALSDQGEPRAGHIEKGPFALGVAGLLSKPNTFSRVCSIFSGVWHTQTPDTSKDILQCKQRRTGIVPATQKGRAMFDVGYVQPNTPLN
jgi:hypothetical protein